MELLLRDKVAERGIDQVLAALNILGGKHIINVFRRCTGFSEALHYVAHEGCLIASECDLGMVNFRGGLFFMMSRCFWVELESHREFWQRRHFRCP